MSTFALFLHFPGIVWTTLVGISLVYWLFVVSGLVHFGEGADAAEGLGHVGHGDVDVGHADAGDVGDAGGHDADAGYDVDEAAGAAGFFRLRNVPVTVAASLIAFFSWLVTLVGLTLARHYAVYLSLLSEVGLAFVLAPLVGFLCTKLAVRPLTPLLQPRRAKSSRDLLGQSCTIRTGEADERFGEATVKDTGADLVLRVRVEGGAPMKRGDEGVIVGFDEEREEYIVAPIDEIKRR